MTRPAPGWSLPRVFAHRCGGALAPENTLAGLRVAAALGVEAVEFDVMLSADGTPWLIHDETLERTTNGTGSVCETSDAVLRRLDAGAFHHRAFAGERLATLEEAAQLCRELGLNANVEIKPAAGFEEATGRVVAEQVIRLWCGASQPLLSSFSEVALASARRVGSELALAVLWHRPPADWLARGEALKAFSMHCAASQIEDPVLDAAKSAGVPVLCYTVNDAALADALLARGVSAVFSDRPDRVR